MQNKPKIGYSPISEPFRRLIIALILLVPFLLSAEKPTQAFAQNIQKPNTSIFIPSVIMGRSTVAAPVPDWLAYLNAYRAMAFLPELTENTSWSNGGLAHSRYTVKNDILMHSEDAGNPWYTPEGLVAAQSGNLMGSYDSTASDRHAIDSWMQAPFHALGILDPSLQQVGFGSYRELDGGLQMGATLDVLQGLGPISPSVVYPVAWPGNGTTVALTRFYSETPNPLTSCPGYTAPSGLPIVLQLGQGNLTPSVTSYSFSQGSARLESCLFTEGTYTHPDANAQSLGRAILNERDAVVLVPRLPLVPGATYTVSITASGQTYTWSFNVATTVLDLNVASEPPAGE